MKFKRVFLTLILLMFLFPFAAYAAETDGEQLYYEQYYDSGADKLTDFLPDGTREYFEKVEFIFAEARRQIITPIITRIYVGS